MAEAAGVTESILKLPGQWLDEIAGLLSVVGIDLAPFTLQLFLLALVAALLWPAYKKLRARKKADRTPLILVVALGLSAFGILLGMIENGTTPDRVAGWVSSDRLADVHVALLDFRGRPISRGSGAVDTQNGRFALHYSPLVDGRARQLRIVVPGCREQDVELSRAQLRAGAELQWTHQCVAS